MLKKAFIFLAAFMMVTAPSVSEAKPKGSLNGCQLSRKGTKIRCPNGKMYIRQDIVDRKIAAQSSGSGVKKKNKKTGKKASKARS